jgi:hypothetical protein
MAETFDPDARDYPSDYPHDVTLFSPTDITMLADFRAPIANLGWLSEDSWHHLREGHGSIHVLGNISSTQKLGRTEVIPNAQESDCQVS